MQNYKQEGKVLDYVIPSGDTITSGDVIVIGPGLVGVASKSGEEGETIPVRITGVFELAKEEDLEVSVGDKLYYNEDDKVITKTVTDVKVGAAVKDSADTATTVDVLLIPEGAQYPAIDYVASITAPNGSDAGTTQTLANATKTTVNEILTALQEQGIMKAS